ncbi:hypothetical protein BpHYR1_006503 [Brachionus plicatilis]|uniref:Uncharacterized protein n=1 Tax=Brachionus plicatilis TaxID=10195 RepID=A0A3M7SQI2_BRAPC|nr:hypothetical protein BpHYR1_006503 [Brachionus plicatilis]
MFNLNIKFISHTLNSCTWIITSISGVFEVLKYNKFIITSKTTKNRVITKDHKSFVQVSLRNINETKRLQKKQKMRIEENLRKDVFLSNNSCCSEVTKK